MENETTITLEAENVTIEGHYCYLAGEHFVGIRFLKFLTQFDWLMTTDKLRIQFLHDPVVYEVVGTAEEIDELFNSYYRDLQEEAYVLRSDTEKQAIEHRKEFRAKHNLPS